MVNSEKTISTGSGTQSTPVRDDRIYKETKWLAAIIVPFLLVAFYILYLRTSETKDLFAWEIKSHMTAMMLGAAYIGGATFFLSYVARTPLHLTRNWLFPGRPLASGTRVVN